VNAQTSPRVQDAFECDEGELQGLLSQVAGRDEQALGRFYDRTLSRIYGLILRVVRNPADAEEVVGDLYLQVWERAADYDSGRGPAIAWLKTLAWSRAVDRQRRGRRFAHDVQLHPEGGDAAYTDCESQSAELAVMAWSSAQAVQRSFSALSDMQKRILTLALQQDMSHQEISAATSIPLGTVKSHARRGLARLRAALAGEDGEHV
jgi:RNA polymerase sigma-70 factor (ECF subfamily)